MRQNGSGRKVEAKIAKRDCWQGMFTALEAAGFVEVEPRLGGLGQRIGRRLVGADEVSERRDPHQRHELAAVADSEAANRATEISYLTRLAQHTTGQRAAAGGSVERVWRWLSHRGCHLPGRQLYLIKYSRVHAMRSRRGCVCVYDVCMPCALGPRMHVCVCVSDLKVSVLAKNFASSLRTFGSYLAEAAQPLAESSVSA